MEGDGIVDVVLQVKKSICWGETTLKGTRVPVRAMWDRWIAGDTIHFLAYDYAIEHSQVEKALREWGNTVRRRELIAEEDKARNRQEVLALS